MRDLEMGALCSFKFKPHFHRGICKVQNWLVSFFFFSCSFLHSLEFWKWMGQIRSFCIKEILVLFSPNDWFWATKTLNQKQKLSSRFASEDWESISPPVLFHINNQTMNQPNWSWRTKERWILTKRISDLSLGINMFMLHSLLFTTVSLAQLLIK